MHDLAVGDRVEWNTPQGPHRGTILERRSSDFHFSRQRFTASDEEPAYIVLCDHTGTQAAHRGELLRRIT